MKKSYYSLILYMIACTGYSWSNTVPNSVPTITTIANQSTCMNVGINNLAFSISDNETAASDLLVDITSTDTNLLPLTNITIGGTDGDRTISMNPATGVVGSSDITIKVTDALGAFTSTTFTVVVTGLNITTTAGMPQVYNTGMSITVDAGVTINQTLPIEGASVSISEGFAMGDTLSFNGTLPPGVTAYYNSDHGVFSFSGTIEPGDLQAMMSAIEFSTTSTDIHPRTILFSLGSAISNPVNGHFYEYVSGGYSWTEARDAAAARSFYGLQGYLATVTSEEENGFLVAKLTGDGWLGGSDDYNQINTAAGTTLYANKAEAEGKFYWITGPEKGQKFSENNFNPITQPGLYANWAGGEPNDWGGDESYTQIYFGNNGKWNDLNNYNGLGYIVEYGGMGNEPCLALTATKTIDVLFDNMPIIATIANQSSCLPVINQTVNFEVSDVESSAENLILLLDSSNDTVLPEDHIILSGNGQNRTLTFSTMPGVYGTSTITITVKDEFGGQTVTTFLVVIGDANKPTVITKNITVTLDASTGQATVTPVMIDDNSIDDCGIASYQLATGSPVSDQIYFTGSDGMLWKANRDGSGSPSIVYDYHNGYFGSESVDVNLGNGMAYLAGGWNGQVYKAPIAGNGSVDSVYGSWGYFSDVELDTTTDKLFYSGYYNGISTTSLDGLAPSTQILNDYYIAGMTLDKTHQKIYYSTLYGSIGVVNVDGSDANTYLFSANSPRGITMDEANGRLFWVDENEKNIYTALVDGSEGPNVLYSYATDNNYIYGSRGIDYDSNTNNLLWTAYGNANDDTVYTAPANGSGAPVKLFSGNFGNLKSIAAGRNVHGVSLHQYTDAITYTNADIGTQTLYLIVTDASGNVSYAPATVTVIGNNVAMANVSQPVDAGLCAASVTTPQPQIGNIEDLIQLTWAITGATTMNSAANGINYLGVTNFNTGMSTVTYTATDAGGTITTYSCNVTVTDNELPTVVTKDITVYLDANGNAVLTPDQIDNGSTDNCQIASYQLLANNPVSPKIYFTGSNGMLWKANRNGEGAPEIIYDYHQGAYFSSEGVDVNLDNGNAYFGGGYENQIYVAPTNGTGAVNPVSPFINESWGNIQDVEIDTVANLIFYPNNNDGIFSTAIDGSSPPNQIVSDVNALGLTLDKIHHKIYFTTPYGSIGVVNEDGSAANTNLFYANSPRGITMDEATERLFWVDEYDKNIYTALANGTEQPQVLYSYDTDNGYVYGSKGIDYDAATNALYWTAYGYSNDDTVYTAPANGTGTPTILYKGNFGNIRGIAAGKNIHGTTLTLNVDSIHYTADDLGVHTEYLVVTDSHGNVSTVPATVTVAEYTPVLGIVCQQPISTHSDVDTCSALIAVDAPAFTNEELLTTLAWTMTGATTAASEGEGINYVGEAVFNLGSTTVTYIANEGLASQVECSFTVTVSDNQLPTISAPEAITVPANAGCSATGVNLGTPETSDNCTVVTVENDAPESFPLGDTTVTWTVTDGGGSTATATQVVTVTPLLPTVITPVVYCQTTEATALEATGINLKWYLSETDLEGSTIAPIPSTLEAGTFSYWVSQSVNGCESPRVKIDVEVNGHDVTITNDSGNLIVAEADAVYQWMNCDDGFSIIPQQTNQTFTPVTSGSYSVDVTKNGCTIRSACVDITVLAVHDIHTEDMVKLYPNPTKDHVTVELTSFANSQLNVFDVRGRHLFSQSLNNALNTINISNLPTGVYLFKISNDSGIVTKRVIKQ